MEKVLDIKINARAIVNLILFIVDILSSFCYILPDTPMILSNEIHI